ncbi:TPA: hypothetical protein ACT3KR_005510, partial [Raoultella planticola]
NIIIYTSSHAQISLAVTSTMAMQFIFANHLLTALFKTLSTYFHPSVMKSEILSSFIISH